MAGHQKAQAMIRNLEWSVPLVVSPGGERHQGNNQSCLCDDASIKITVGSQKFQVGEHIHQPAEWVTSTPQGQKLFSAPVVVHLCPCSYPLIYSKLLNISKF